MKTNKLLIGTVIQTVFLTSVATAGDVEIHLPAAADAMTVDQPAGTELMRVNGNGDVGIGTETPDTKLHISDSSGDVVMKFTNEGAAAADWSGMEFENDTGGGNYIWLGSSTFSSNNNDKLVIESSPNHRGLKLNAKSPTEGNIEFFYGGVSQSRVLMEGSTGHVGIGTTAPASVLDVAGSTSASITLRDGDAAINEPGHIAGLQLYDGGGNRTGVVGFSTSVEGMSIRNFNDDGGITFSTGGNNNQLSIAADGNVGIGGVVAASELHIIDTNGDDEGQIIINGGASGNISVKSHMVDGTQLMSLGSLTVPEAINIKNNGGDVGIGTTAPERELHVVGTIQADNTQGFLALKRNTDYTTTGHGSGIIGGFSPTSNQVGHFGFLNTNTDPDDPEGRFFIQLDTDNDESNEAVEHHFNVTHTGSVGIGTIDPAAKLDVAGNIKIGDSAEVCDSDQEGEIRYEATLKKHQGCDGTSWNNLY